MLPEHIAIDEYARFFHSEQNRHQRLFDFQVYILQRVCLLQLAPQMLVKLESDVRVLGRIRRSLLQVDLVERKLFRSLTCNILEMNGVDIEPGGSWSTYADNVIDFTSDWGICGLNFEWGGKVTDIWMDLVYTDFGIA